MRTVLRITGPGAVGCRELEAMGFVNTSECCEKCHHAERYAPGLVAGPCRVALTDGREAFVCCASKHQLRGGRARDGAARTKVRAPRGPDGVAG